jgi:GntR family transcriptional regulator/MocR family aminotransferase
MTDVGNLPLYEAVYQRIKAAIRNRELSGRLPSKNAAAALLQVSKVTVERAYEQLKAEGYLRSRARSGFFVAFTAGLPPEPGHVLPPPCGAPARPEVEHDLSTYAVSADAFPFATWSRLIRKVLSGEGEKLLRSTPPKGIRALREQIASYLQAYRGIYADPEQVLVGAGTEWMASLFIQLLGPRQRFAIENPGYRKVWRMLAAHGMDMVSIPMRSDGIDLSELERHRPDVVHITPSHHFPLGMVMPIAKRTALLAMAENMDFHIIEDDYDSEFRFRGRPIPALQGLDKADRVIYINTFAKSLAPSLRVSYMVLPPPLLATYERDFAFYSCTVPGFEQHVLARFMGEGHFERHLNRMRTVYKAKHDALVTALEQSALRNRLRLTGKNVGLHFLLRLEGRLNERQMVERARQEGVAIAGLSEFYSQKRNVPKNTVVIGFADLATPKIPALVAALEKAWA